MEENTVSKRRGGAAVEAAPVSPLRNERISVRFVPHKGGPWGDDPKHALSGGMADNAMVGLTVPVNNKTGAYCDVLTKDEREYLEEALGLDPNRLSPFNKEDNYWENYTVTVGKRGTTLDLSNPEDYIRYKVLLANGDIIAKSLQEVRDRPKNTYRFVLVKASDETSMENSRMDSTMESYKEFGRIDGDVDTMRVLVELLDARPYAANTGADFLRARINTLIQADASKFLKAVKDPMLHTKVVLRRASELGKVSRRNDLYYTSDGRPMCDTGEDSTLPVAARWLNKPANCDVKALLEAEVDKARTERK